MDMVNNDEIDAAGRFGLDEMCREGARTMLVSAPRPRSIKFTTRRLSHPGLDAHPRTRGERLHPSRR